MVWTIFENTEEADGVRRWCFFVLLKGKRPSQGARPFVSGVWLIGDDPAADLAGKQLFEAGRAAADAEAARLNRAGQPPRR